MDRVVDNGSYPTRTNWAIPKPEGAANINLGFNRVILFGPLFSYILGFFLKLAQFSVQMSNYYPPTRFS